MEGHGNSNSPKDYSFIDKEVLRGKYSYRLKQIDTDGKFEYSKVIEVTIENIPLNFELLQNFPNPFNPVTKIKYSIPDGTLRHAQSDNFVVLKVYDVLGNEIATLVNEYQEAYGSYEVSFEAASLASGVYLYKLETGSFTDVKKMVLLR